MSETGFLEARLMSAFPPARHASAAVLNTLAAGAELPTHPSFDSGHWSGIDRHALAGVPAYAPLVGRMAPSEWLRCCRHG